MLSNRLAFAALGLACVTAAGGGSYLATRQNAASVAAPTADTSSTLVESSTQTVQETEAVVGDIPQARIPAVAEPIAIAPPTPPARRAEAPVRPAPRQRRAVPTVKNAPQPPVLDRTWPSSAESAPPSSGAVTNDTAVTLPHEEHQVVDTPRAPEPPAKTIEELVVSADSVIGLQTDRALSSERARVEDPVEARVARDVRVDGQVAVPAGTRAVGSVMVVERGGKFKERARLGIRFHTLVMADGTRLPITTETVYRYGDAPGNSSAAKIGGGAVAGAILGAILGGGKGAAVGAATGAGAGTAAAASSNRSEATFPAGAEVTARILSPVTITHEK
jgi:hypothetical protein